MNYSAKVGVKAHYKQSHDNVSHKYVMKKPQLKEEYRQELLTNSILRSQLEGEGLGHNLTIQKRARGHSPKLCSNVFIEKLRVYLLLSEDIEMVDWIEVEDKSLINA